MTNGVMNGAMNRKVLVLLGPVAGLIMFAGAVWMASMLVNREYREPYRAPVAAVDPTPRGEGLAAERADAEAKARAKPYEEVEYRRFPVSKLPMAWPAEDAWNPSAYRFAQVWPPKLNLLGDRPFPGINMERVAELVGWGRLTTRPHRT